MTTNPGSTVGMSGSYNENSDPQLAIINLMIPYIHSGIDELDISSSSSPMVITDFGASHGKNSIKAMKIFLEYLKQTNKLVASPLIVHNDLPTNDWTTLFQLLSEDKSYQGVANGCSFYERCLPSNSLSLGFTASSMHWLSKTPCNIRNHCFHTYAEEDERQAYGNQSKLDFNSFIEHRSQELVPGGVLVLSIPSVDDLGKESTGNYFDLLYMCGQILFNEQELLYLTIPIYLRSLSECIDPKLFERCSLKLIKAELSHLKLPILELYHNGQLTFDQLVKIFTKVFQSTMDPLLKLVLEKNGRSKEEINELLKDFWVIYEDKLKERPDLVTNRNQYVCACLILTKI
ncbi:unnamed protein product [Rotaria sp. Silwood1]|nr:unnamed protein product [Rotaria sp. Silwood1]CAF3607301.1 unnamed protein product [Rotaria sp. Silwood1]CAF3620892.1 unnamed protein product [Rotaria sp. Silwood1]CAF3647453.1 unnamed protein product [Rotaria sp. Silwood1]CAF4787678.1 unnamed protein product [Rotaria sp. Silwood1]